MRLNYRKRVPANKRLCTQFIITPLFLFRSGSTARFTLYHHSTRLMLILYNRQAKTHIRICIAVKNAVSDPQNSLFIVVVVVAMYVGVLCPALRCASFHRRYAFQVKRWAVWRCLQSNSVICKTVEIRVKQTKNRQTELNAPKRSVQ